MAAVLHIPAAATFQCLEINFWLLHVKDFESLYGFVGSADCKRTLNFSMILFSAKEKRVI